MPDNTIDSEPYDPFLIATLQAMQKEDSTHHPTHYVFDMNELVNLIAQEANKELDRYLEKADPNLIDYEYIKSRQLNLTAGKAND